MLMKELILRPFLISTHPNILLPRITVNLFLQGLPPERVFPFSDSVQHQPGPQFALPAVRAAGRRPNAALRPQAGLLRLRAGLDRRRAGRGQARLLLGRGRAQRHSDRRHVRADGLQGRGAQH